MMKLLKKPIFTLMLSLLIGFGLGYYVKNLLVKEQYKKFISFFYEKGFVKKMSRITNASEEDLDVISPFLHHRGQQIESLHKKQKQDMIYVLDSLIMDLEPHLDEDQIVPIKEMQERMKKYSKKKKYKKK